ncbi:MAG: serine/threonine protein kinase [Myxococcales bacterium]|nr:serine/threonine protein kinase [Myxococcales bacterium]MBP6848483.1 serine/threonine protein kinase [Kofleriaceae bacterium]
MTQPNDPSGTFTQEQFGPYAVFERLGVGGMATVHRAKQRGIEGIERVVALKRLLPHLAEDATFIKSFVREAKLALMLQHANVVQLFELGKVGGVYFIAMEYIDGRDVRRILRQARKVSGPPTINVTLSLLIQACEALEYAHTKCDDDGEPLGLVHRDVSPSNLMVTRSGHLKVIDFGIAKAQSQQLRTQTGRVKGKLAYMAPEAISGKELDARSDLFSIGVIAHELLTARPLFASKNEYQTLLNVQKSDILPPSAFNQAVPPELDAIVLRALARDPDHRYSSAAELRDDLHAVRIRYQLSATNREVQAWCDWAFALEAPEGNFSGPAVTDSLAGQSRSPVFSRTPPPALPLRAPSQTNPPMMARAKSDPGRPRSAADEEEAADVAWGGGQEHDSQQHEHLDDIPDYSQPGPAGGLAAVQHEADPRDSATLIGIMAPQAGSARPSAFPHGSSSDAVPRRRPTSTSSPVAVPVDAGDATAPNPRTSSPAIGASIVEQRGGAGAKIAVALLAIAALAVGGYVAFGRGGGKPAGKGGTPEVTAAPPGTLKFIVEPADAQIKIPGMDVHDGAPWTIPLEPGVIQVKISRDGFVSWETSIELSSNETQTIRAVLAPAPAGPEANMAMLVLDSEPQGLTVLLDGKELEQKTPLKMAVEPGSHNVSLRQAGEVMWRQHFVAEARTQYEFSPSMSEVKRREREEREAQAALAQQQIRDARPAAPRPTQPTVAPPAPPPLPPGPSVAPPPAGSGSAPAIVAPPPAGSGATVAVVKPALPTGGSSPPPPVVTPPKPSGPPPVVPPNAVKRTSGELPRITTITRPGDAAPPSSVSAKICIDASGAVTSASVFKLTGDVASKLTSAIKAWRFTPYQVAGKATPACFVNTFALK